MKKYRIYYSIQNNGDGSASTIFFEDSDDADKHQENLHEGWGEDCTGHIEFTIDKGEVSFRGAKWNEQDEDWDNVKCILTPVITAIK